MSNDEIWPVPPTYPFLAENEVHVWKVELDKLANKSASFQLLLIDTEIERAGRFFFEKHRQYWIGAHAILRIILGHYLNVEPTSLRFTTNDYGKPSIIHPPAGKRLRFNLSHSGDLALYAFAYDKEVGVDVEQRRSDIEYEDLAAHYFSSYECATLRSLPLEVQEEAFFSCWSRKEAYIKARGKGLSLALDQFDVSLSPQEPARLLGCREEPEAVEHWSLRAIFPAAGYAGALVAEGFDWQLRCWQWQDELLQKVLILPEKH